MLSATGDLQHTGFLLGQAAFPKPRLEKDIVSNIDNFFTAPLFKISKRRLYLPRIILKAAGLMVTRPGFLTTRPVLFLRPEKVRREGLPDTPEPGGAKSLIQGSG